jgi:hypothetical protein
MIFKSERNDAEGLTSAGDVSSTSPPLVAMISGHIDISSEQFAAHYFLAIGRLAVGHSQLLPLTQHSSDLLIIVTNK